MRTRPGVPSRASVITISTGISAAAMANGARVAHSDPTSAAHARREVADVRGAHAGCSLVELLWADVAGCGSDYLAQLQPDADIYYWAPRAARTSPSAIVRQWPHLAPAPWCGRLGGRDTGGNGGQRQLDVGDVDRTEGSPYDLVLGGRACHLQGY